MSDLQQQGFTLIELLAVVTIISRSRRMQRLMKLWSSASV